MNDDEIAALAVELSRPEYRVDIREGRCGVLATRVNARTGWSVAHEHVAAALDAGGLRRQPVPDFPREILKDEHGKALPPEVIEANKARVIAEARNG